MTWLLSDHWLVQFQCQILESITNIDNLSLLNVCHFHSYCHPMNTFQKIRKSYLVYLASISLHDLCFNIEHENVIQKYCLTYSKYTKNFASFTSSCLHFCIVNYDHFPPWFVHIFHAFSNHYQKFHSSLILVVKVLSFLQMKLLPIETVI